jgi:hypothetical protein
MPSPSAREAQTRYEGEGLIQPYYRTPTTRNGSRIFKENVQEGEGGGGRGGPVAGKRGKAVPPMGSTGPAERGKHDP